VTDVEVKVVFREEDDITRILRGTISKEDDHFIWLKRTDGIFRIGKAYIVKIEGGV